MEALSTWLIGTVAGVVLLGAIGSLLAVFLLNKGKIWAETWVPRIETWAGRAVQWWLDYPLEESLTFKFTAKTYDVVAFFAWELAKLLFLPWLALFFYRGALAAFAAHKGSDLPLAALFQMVIFFLLVYQSLKAFVKLWFHRIFTVKGGLYDTTVKEQVGARLQDGGGSES